MTTTFGTHNGIESTIELLHAELPRLEAQQQTLEKELAEVSERLESVRMALHSLQALSPAPLQPQAASAVPDVAADKPVEAAPAPEGSSAQPEPAAEDRRRKAPVPAPRKVDTNGSARKKATAGRKRAVGAAKTQRPAGRVAGKAAAAPKQVKKAAVAKRASGLMDGVVACLAKAGGPMRAGEVNKVLGREETAGSVNAVRTALERLAKASRVERVGRGLYQTA